MYGLDRQVALAANENKGKRPRIHLSVFREAVRHIQQAGGFTADMLRDKPVRALVDQTAECLLEAVDMGLRDNDIPQEMAERLDRDVFVFSGCKTYHELREASQLLRDDEGRIRPFRNFFEEVKALHPAYNENYLGAEYEFAVHAAQSAAQWAEIEREGDDYDLQYRTANDSRVRAEHAPLEGITLPPSDPFWNEYMPPNGWRCRCRAVQIRKGKSERSDSQTALQLGREATTQNDAQGRNKAEMFRFNPGRERVIFPKHHPYYNLSVDARNVVETMSDERQHTGAFSAQTIAEAEAEFREVLGLKCNLKGLRKQDLNIARDLFESIRHHLEMAPELKKVVHFAGTVAGRIEELKTAYYNKLRSDKLYDWCDDEHLMEYAGKKARAIASVKRNTLAYYHAAGAEFGLDCVVYNAANNDRLQRVLKESVDSKQSPEKCLTAKYLFDHEFGHSLDQRFGLSRDQQIRGIISDAMSKGEQYVTDNLCSYAYTSDNPVADFIAEAWGEYQNSDTPRPIAKQIGDIMIRIMKQGAIP